MTAPGPPELGRGVVLDGADAVPAAWVGRAGRWSSTRRASPPRRPWSAPCTRPGPGAGRWSCALRRRTPTGSGRRRRSTLEPWRLGARFELWHDRLHFLVWANTYDARGGIEPVWWWGRKAARLGRRSPAAAGDRRCPTARRRGSTAARAAPSPVGPWSCTAKRSRRGRLAAGCPGAGRGHRRAGARPAGRRRPRRRARPASSPPPARARRACSPSGCATCSSTGAASGRASSPSPTTSGPSSSWRSARADFRPRASTLNALGHRLLGARRAPPRCSTSATSAASSTTSSRPGRAGPTPTRSPRTSRA